MRQRAAEGRNPGQNRRLHQAAEKPFYKGCSRRKQSRAAAQDKRERVQVMVRTGRMAVSEIRLGGEFGGGQGGGQEQTDQQGAEPCMKRLAEPPAHQLPRTVTASSSVASLPSGSVASAWSSQSPAMSNAKSWV